MAALVAAGFAEGRVPGRAALAGPGAGAARGHVGAAPRARLRARGGRPCPRVPVERAAAEELLVRRYLGGFGPASPSDVARYAGWSITETQAPC